VTPALKQYVEKKIEKVTRQFKTVGDITAVLRVEKDNHIAEITVPANGILLRAQETTKDMYSSIDLVVEKIERQVHKYKTRLMRRKYNNFRDLQPVEAAPDLKLRKASSRSLRTRALPCIP
jgi:putative sigma-54 modulation protein